MKFMDWLLNRHPIPESGDQAGQRRWLVEEEQRQLQEVKERLERVEDQLRLLRRGTP